MILFYPIYAYLPDPCGEDIGFTGAGLYAPVDLFVDIIEIAPVPAIP